MMKVALKNVKTVRAALQFYILVLYLYSQTHFLDKVLWYKQTVLTMVNFKMYTLINVVISILCWQIGGWLKWFATIVVLEMKKKTLKVDQYLSDINDQGLSSEVQTFSFSPSIWFSLSPQYAAFLHAIRIFSSRAGAIIRPDRHLLRAQTREGNMTEL